MYGPHPADLSLKLGCKKTLLLGATSHRRLGVWGESGFVEYD